jgi:tetratricopeptide (TPR) repeat protein
MITFAPQITKTHILTIMAEKDKQQTATNIDLGEGISKAEGYLNENKKSLSIIGGAVLVIILGYFGYNLLVVKPQEENARKEMFAAERYFQADSVDRALNGDGQFMGFIDIIDSYGASTSANIAHYYAGMCYMKKGEWASAIEYLKGYDAEDDITGALAYGAIGDASIELGNNEEALKYYKMAVDWDKNQFTAPLFLMKVAFAQELLNDFKSAALTYERLKKDYPSSTEARDIDRYIIRAANKAKAG